MTKVWTGVAEVWTPQTSTQTAMSIPSTPVYTYLGGERSGERISSQGLQGKWCRQVWTCRQRRWGLNPSPIGGVVTGVVTGVDTPTDAVRVLLSIARGAP